MNFVFREIIYRVAVCPSRAEEDAAGSKAVS
jgi:hypothetical protein